MQNPHYFMVANLGPSDMQDPAEHINAAHLGEDLNTSSQSSLAGTVVSSLHRLKDIDNSGKPLSAHGTSFEKSTHTLSRRKWLLRLPGHICQD